MDWKWISIGVALVIVAFAMVDVWNVGQTKCFDDTFVLVNDSTGSMYQNSRISFEKRFSGPVWIDCDSPKYSSECDRVFKQMPYAVLPIWLKQNQGHSGVMNESVALNWCQEVVKSGSGNVSWVI